MASKKRTKVSTHRIVNDTFQYALFVRIGGTREGAIQWFEKKFSAERPEVQNVNGPTGTTFYKNYETSHLIWFAETPTPGITAHEALHSVRHVLTTIGFPEMCEQNEEAFAYLLQWTVNRIAELGR
jgi:hypothetical protein